MDLSTAFDTINYDLLIAKIHAYGFNKNALDLVSSYLKKKKEKGEDKYDFQYLD